MSKSYVTNEMLFKAILLLHTEITEIHCSILPKHCQKQVRDEMNDWFYDNLGLDHGRREEKV